MNGELGTVGEGGTIELLNGENEAPPLAGLLSLGGPCRPTWADSGDLRERSGRRTPAGAVPGLCGSPKLSPGEDIVLKSPWYDAGLTSCGRWRTMLPLGPGDDVVRWCMTVNGGLKGISGSCVLSFLAFLVARPCELGFLRLLERAEGEKSESALSPSSEKSISSASEWAGSGAGLRRFLGDADFCDGMGFVAPPLFLRSLAREVENSASRSTVQYAPFPGSLR